MSKPDVRVFIEFNTNFVETYAFLLDDATQGVLDGDFGLAGFTFIEVTQYLQGVDGSRGKTRILDRFDAGLFNIQLDNSTRIFDPRFEDSPFFGAILPRLNVRIEANGEPVYTGLILDWNIEYELGGNSTATAVCADRFTILAQTILESDINDLEFSGERIDAILSRPEVNWPAELRDIDTGLTIVQEDVIPEGQIALPYLQLVETTESGALFIAKDGKLTFRQRNTAPILVCTFSDVGEDIGYVGISVVFGSELLFNRIEVMPLGLDTIVVDDVLSQLAYETSTLAVETLNEYEEDAQDLANSLLSKFSQPEYRFEALEIDLNRLSVEDQDLLLSIELNDFVNVVFTPSGIPPAIQLSAQVIGINHTIDQVSHFMTINLASSQGAPFVLDSPSLGVLDSNTLAY
jgi:hypothetical protein